MYLHFFADPNNEIAEYPLQVVYSNPPNTSKFGVIGYIEGDRAIVTLMGFDGVHLPNDLEGFIKFARDLDNPYIYEKIKNKKPISPFRSYVYPRMIKVKICKFHFECCSEFSM